MVERSLFRWLVVDHDGVNITDRFFVFFKLVLFPHQLRAQADDVGGKERFATMGLFGGHLLSSRQTS